MAVRKVIYAKGPMTAEDVVIAHDLVTVEGLLNEIHDCILQIQT